MKNLQGKWNFGKKLVLGVGFTLVSIQSSISLIFSFL